MKGRISKDSKVFDRYATFYDAIYADKDYEAEARFVLDLMKRHGEAGIGSILDIGCGTGGHLLHFARAGLRVTGLDSSEGMSRKAADKIKEASRQMPRMFDHTPVVRTADARSFRDAHRYDAAVAMFAVIGYLTRNADLLAAFSNIRAHLRKGGCFVFDVWFGPAVYTEKPETRIKETVLGDSKVIRFAAAEIDPIGNIVRVDYTILELRDRSLISEVHEVHEMRFFFVPELEFLLHQAALEMVEVCPFMSPGKAPTAADWNISVVAKAI